MQSLRLLVALALLTIAPRGVVAGPVTWSFTGTVFEAQIHETQFEGTIQVGSPLEGTLTFDDLTSDARPKDPHLGAYFIGNSYELNFLIGEFHSKNDPYVTIEPVLTVTNDSTAAPPGSTPPDHFNLLETIIDFDEVRGVVYLSLIDLSGTMFQSDQLPTIPPAVLGLDLAMFAVVTSGFTARANLDTLAAIPEPATGLLAVLGLIALLRRKRRASTQSTTA